MKVCLDIEDHDKLPPLCPGADPLPSFTTNASAVVSASITLEDGDATGLYMLQVGSMPDIRVCVNIADLRQKVDFKWDHYDSKLKYNVAESNFKLFRDTMGTSLLYLIEYKDKQARFIPMAEVTILLENSDVRGGYYDRMVKNLLDKGLPHFVLNDFKWQMARNQFSVGWSDGYTSVESPDVMLRALLRVVKKMRPLLAQINESAQMSFCGVLYHRRISQISHCNNRTLAGISSALRFRGSDRIVDVSEETVLEPRRLATFNTHAHSALYTFLDVFVLNRINIVDDNLSVRIKRQERQLSDLLGNESPSKKNILAENSAVLQSFQRKLWATRRLRKIVFGLMSYPIFLSGHEALSIFDVDVAEFSCDDAYLKLYFLMLDYSRARFWWVGDKMDGIWRIPKIEMGENGESRLQLKYSIVYENWCYAHMILALRDELKYNCIDGRMLENCDEGSIVFRKGDIEVKLLHGITAWKRNKKKNSEFVYSGDRSSKKTPDFAIVIRDCKTNKEKWAVLDAKSDGGLRPHMVEVRSEYASNIKRRIEGREEEPFASVLLRSGELNGGDAAIDFPPLPIVEDRVASVPKDEDLLNDHSKDDYKWEAGCGIVEGEETPPPYHGDLRVNVSSLANNETVFSEFMEGLIFTALRLLREEREEQAM